ncbi:hypothetical protein RB195_009821 [Necator americanus]|uniref:Uncharacterized protein n=1 Tax=Necator americanus TaxID=51031 RepID=A0ABR1CYD8_NECAM
MCRTHLIMKQGTSGQKGVEPDNDNARPNLRARMKKKEKMSAYERAKKVYEQIQEEKQQQRLLRKQEEEERQAALEKCSGGGFIGENRAEREINVYAVSSDTLIAYHFMRLCIFASVDSDTFVKCQFVNSQCCMPGQRRRPPPGQSFPFLRKGQGQKAKVNYPVLNKVRTLSTTDAPDDTVRSTEGSRDNVDVKSLLGREGSHGGNRWDGFTKPRDLEWQIPSSRKNVQTADSGFDQGGNLNNGLEADFSNDDDSSPRSSSIDTANVELRKGDAFRIQQVAQRKDYSFPDHTTAPSPMLASTPHPEQEVGSPQGLQPISSETSILGDTSNVVQRVDDSASCVDSDPLRGFRHPEVERTDMVRKQRVSKNIRTPQNERPIHFTQANNAYKKAIPSLLLKDSPQEQSPRYPDVERKLIGQLRDVIAHLDLADVKQQIRAKELEDAYVRFKQDVRDFESEREAEKERTSRVRRQLERERKIMNKDGIERDKAISEQVEDLTKTIGQKDRQISTLRLRLRKLEELGESKDKELEENNKKMERMQKTCKTLQREMARLRATCAKQSQEMAAELQAASTRNIKPKGSIGILPSLNREVRKEPSVDDSAPENQLTTQERSKFVSWADKATPWSIHKHASATRKETYEMELVEEGTAYFGPCRLFKNCVGDWTKVTATDCGCDFYEYSNSDVRWFSCDRSAEVYYYGVMGVTIVSLASGRSIHYFNDGQIEIYRLSGEISRFDPVTSQRTETMLDANGSRYVEIFNCTGYCIRFDGVQHITERFEERSSYRGHPPDRHVYNHSNVEPEWIEPEFSARRCPDGSLKMKFANIMICCIGLEDVGYVKHTTRLEDGVEKKKMCVEWGHVARARQRQIENRKCQQFTALSATM